MKLTSHSQELRQRQQTNFSDKELTDQSYKDSCDINQIIANYALTGVLAEPNKNLGSYMDCSQIPSLMDAHDLVESAKQSFMELPAEIRKLMYNNPENLEKFIQNPENHAVLTKNGIIVEKQKTQSATPTSQPAVAKKKADQSEDS